jgi:hypothetical protein
LLIFIRSKSRYAKTVTGGISVASRIRITHVREGSDGYDEIDHRSVLRAARISADRTTNVIFYLVQCGKLARLKRKVVGILSSECAVAAFQSSVRFLSLIGFFMDLSSGEG